MDARIECMANLYKTGHTLQQIGEEYGITRERVRQLIKKAGVAWDEGGAHLRAMVNAADKYRKPKNDGFFITYGCPKEEAELLNGGKCVTTKRSPAHRYMQQRRNAKTRGIRWAITFPQWMAIWEASGHFHERGRGQGYCMARIGDTGPYAADNVEIVTMGQNISDSYYKTPWSERNLSAPKKEFCIRGHKRTPENLYKNGACKECLRIRQHKYRHGNLLPAAHTVYVSESSSPDS